MATFPCSLVTPEQIVLEEEIAALILRTDVGDATYLAGHTPLVGAIVPGLVRFQHEDGTEERVAVHGGFVHVKSDGVTVLAPVAEREQDIDVERFRFRGWLPLLPGLRPKFGRQTQRLVR